MFQLYPEDAAVARLAVHRDGSAMIADHGLDDGEAETGSVLLAGVVGREQALAFFWRETDPGVFDFDGSGMRVVAGAKGKAAALWHGIHRIENEI